jgi:hypothetical protein
LDIAIQLAAEGRERHPIGTIFVLGDPQELAPYLRQLVLNPCHGHAARERTLHRPQFFETLREFSALDGALIKILIGHVEPLAALGFDDLKIIFEYAAFLWKGLT